MKKYKKCPNFTRFLPKNYQNTLIFIIYARKINKIPEFYMIFARILHDNWPKKYFPGFFFFGGGGMCPPPASPISYTYDDSICNGHIIIHNWLL